MRGGGVHAGCPSLNVCWFMLCVLTHMCGVVYECEVSSELCLTGTGYIQ